jgi:hypothetical protein
MAQLMSQVLQLIRIHEVDALKALQGPGTEKAYTDVAIMRQMYRLVEIPPTRARTFLIRTFWEPNPWKALYHYVCVASRGRLRIVVPKRAGRFGEFTVQ